VATTIIVSASIVCRNFSTWVSSKYPKSRVNVGTILGGNGKLCVVRSSRPFHLYSSF